MKDTRRKVWVHFLESWDGFFGVGLDCFVFLCIVIGGYFGGALMAVSTSIML